MTATKKTPDVECTDCAIVLGSDDIVVTVNDQPYCEHCTGACYSCDQTFSTDDLTRSDLDDNVYCESHVPTCEGCDRQSDLQRLDEGDFCDSCSTTCSSCGGTYPNNGDYHASFCSDSRDERCSDCNSYCDRCDEYHAWSCTQSGEEIEGYGHTAPTMWLRNADQLGRDNEPGRYYLGIELEIGTDNMTGTPVKDWAERHLGDRNAMSCKEDSSVEGFEIVTQPMTPAFFEKQDWDGFFAMLNANYPLHRNQESEEHGLHVHIGKVAFGKDTVAMAAYAYLLQQGDHLVRISRRSSTGYCRKVEKPVSTTVLAQNMYSAQGQRIRGKGNVYVGRDAINLINSGTIEIRAFRSTRSANDLRDAVRVTYVAAEYVRSLRINQVPVNPKSLHWNSFAIWTAANFPEAFPSIAGLAVTGSNKAA